MQTDTKTRIRELAAELLQEKGYNAFSYQHIASELGIQKSAVHYHYPTKESLGVDIIRSRRERFGALKQRAQQQQMNSWQELDLFLDVYRHYLVDHQKVCLLGSLGTDYFTLPEGMQLETQQMVNEITDWLGSMLEAGRNSGLFAFKGEPRNKAITVATSLAGSLQMARVAGNDHFYAIVEQIKLEISP